MNKQQALQLLGLAADASTQAIESVYQKKSASCKEKLTSAPTDVLKQKFQQLQASLNEAHRLLASQTVASTSSPLSQTKMADLPSVGKSTTALNLKTGQVLAGRYEIKDQIGAGGMGAVYHAFDQSKQEDIAIKLLLPEMVDNERAKSRFMDEARISSNLSHPSIVNVFDVQQEGKHLFLTMESLEGQDLRSLMETRKLFRQAYDEAEAKALLTSIGGSLSYAHKYTIHRDIKPENIWISEEGEYKLMDFGIARVMSNSQRTQTGMAMGTAYYMAPEQLKGAKVDGRADIYALGVLIYELLTGEVPAGRIKPLRELRKDLSKSFAAAIDKTLEPNPEDRYADIDAFLMAVQGKGKGIGMGAGLPAIPMKGIAIAVVLIIAVLGIGSLGMNGGFDSLLDALKPIDRAVIAQQEAEVARSVGEIKTVKQRIDTARRNLNSDVRDAERNESADLNALTHWQRLTEDNLFAGNTITELEGELSMAETLLRKEAFEQAQQSMNIVKEGYNTLWNEFTSAESLYAAEEKLKREKKLWQTAKQKYDLGDSDDITKAQALEKQVKQSLLIGELKTALQHLQQATPLYQIAKQQIDKLRQARETAQQSQQGWQQRQSEYQVTAKTEQAQAETADLQARKSKQEGQLDTASSQWQQAQQHWQAAIASTQAQVAQIKKERLTQIEKERLAQERKQQAAPVHHVSIQSFKMSETEVTYAQWDACVKLGGCNHNPKDNGWGAR